MNIALDMSFAKGVSLNRGIGRYCKNLIEHLGQECESHSIFYFYPDTGSDAAPLKRQLQLFMQHNEIDLFHILSPFEFFNQEMMNHDYYGDAKVAVTLYDIIPLLFEKQYLDHPEFKAYYMRIIDFIRSCDIIFAISEATKNDAVRIAGMDASKIHVIMAGLDERFKPLPAINRNDLVLRFGIHKPYVMCTGGMDFRKNIERMIEGFAIANKNVNHAYQLVLCCSVTQQDREQLAEKARLLGIPHDLVITDFVSDEDLLLIYNGASLFVFPSLYEGFGLPVLEAMACGIPVVTSNNSSLSEITADAALLIDPYQPAEIAKGIYRILTDPRQRAEYQSKGLLQAVSFRWDKVARKAIEGYEKVTRKKIAIFSPLPPIQSGISDYQERILPLLSQSYDCDLYVDDGYIPHLQIDLSHIQLFRHYQFPANHDQYDAVIYQMGNSGYHLFIIPYMRKYGGIVVLHDLNLHGMTIAWTLGLNDTESYYQVLKADLGDMARSTLDGIKEGRVERPHEHIILNKYYLSNAKAVLVHNRYSEQALASYSTSQVSLARLPVDLPASPAPVRRNRFIYASFGYLPPHKHVDAVIRSLRKLVDYGCKDVEYHVVGQCDGEYRESLEALIKELKLEGYVHFTGRLDREEYVRRLYSTDVAINLRFPTYGESSASLLDTLAHGVPTIVSDIGSFSELPHEVVRKIAADPKQESPLFEAMLSLYRNEAVLTDMSSKARQYIAEHHSVQSYVDKLSSLVEATRKRSGKVLSTILWTDNDRYSPESTQHSAEGGQDQEAVGPPGTDTRGADAGQPRMLELQPARIKRRVRRSRSATYVAYDLNGLPPHAIQQAVLRIPVGRKRGRLRVNRIRRRWRRAGVPVSYRHPIFSRRVRGPMQAEYECTALVLYWLQHPDLNHGLRISGSTLPVLIVNIAPTD